MGDSYTFAPIANDADGDALTFTIANKPTWADFDATNGHLTGIPEMTDVGVTADIVISVSDGVDTDSLAPFDLEVRQTLSGQARVSWAAPTTSADGSALADLAGFTVHFGRDSGTYTNTIAIDDEFATSAEIGGLDSGTWYFAVSAFDESGNHSELSIEVSKDVAP